MNGRTVTFLATMISSTLGMFLFVIIFAVSAIKGYGRFGDDREWKNSKYDDELVEQEIEDEQEDFPELYENDYDMNDYYKREYGEKDVRRYNQN